MSGERFFIKTFGCKVNQYEAQVMRERLLAGGYLEVDSMEDADIVVVNTCTVTAASDAKCFRAIHSARRHKKCVAVTGCLAEDRSLNLSRLKGVGYLISNRNKHRIAEILRGGENEGPGKCGITSFKGHTRAFVKIQDGCDNTCSYCKVRIVRGVSRSRAPEDIYGECLNLIQRGTKEIVLTGVCLGAYGRDLKERHSLALLIKRLLSIPGEWRMRLSSIEPKDITDELILLLEKEDRLCKHLHIPFQSGDDYILRRMRRPYTYNIYRRIVGNIKSHIPDIAISTDIMVGFPGETEKRFLNTVRLLEEVRPVRVHIFPYSPRRGTEAYNYGDEVSYRVKKHREEMLFDITRRLALEFVKGLEGKDCRALVEDRRDREGLLQGYTDRYIKMDIEGPDSIKGQFVICRLALTNSKAYGILSLYQI